MFRSYVVIRCYTVYVVVIRSLLWLVYFESCRPYHTFQKSLRPPGVELCQRFFSQIWAAQGRLFPAVLESLEAGRCGVHFNLLGRASEDFGDSDSLSADRSVVVGLDIS